MLERERHIKEVYDLKHINDNEIHRGFDYETNLLNNTLSNVMFKNDTTKEFLDQDKDLLLTMVESTLTIRNFFNYSVSKFYNRHNN